MKFGKEPKRLGKISYDNISYVLKEGVIDLNLAGHYICVYILDKSGNYSYIYGLKS